MRDEPLLPVDRAQERGGMRLGAGEEELVRGILEGAAADGAAQAVV